MTRARPTILVASFLLCRLAPACARTHDVAATDPTDPLGPIDEHAASPAAGEAGDARVDPPGSATSEDAGPSEAGAADAGEAGPGASAGPLSDPKRLACGGSVCKTDVYEQCCSPSPGGDRFCSTAISGCSVRAQCDERADCWDGTLCCASTTSAGRQWVFDSVCLAGGAGVCEFNGGFQLCKTNAECNGAVCSLKTCGGRTFASCGTLPAWFSCL